MANTHSPNAGSPNSGGVNVPSFTPGLVDGTFKVVGSYDIESTECGDIDGSMQVVEKKTGTEVQIPANVFEIADFPNAPPDETLGQFIPIAFGKVKGVRAFLIDSTTFRFKLLDHSVINMTAFYNQDGEGFTPNSIDVFDSEFTFTAWNETDTLFVNVDAGVSNPVDAVKLLFIDEVRGAGIDVSELDTTSTDGRGFGNTADGDAADGARTKYIVGVNTDTAAETNSFEYAKYIPDAVKVSELIDEVKATVFAFAYVGSADGEFKHQFRAWEPAVGQGQLVLTESNVSARSPIKLQVQATDPITQVTAVYDVNNANDSTRQVTSSNDLLRELRRLPKHTTLEVVLPLSNREGAKRWAEMQVRMLGSLRRTYRCQATSQFKEVEQGDTLRIEWEPLGISQVVNVIGVTQVPGRVEVGLVMMDVFSFQDEPAFYGADPPVFPDSLGGANITEWDDTWEEDQERFARENLGFYSDENGYADVVDDPQGSHRAGVYV